MSGHTPGPFRCDVRDQGGLTGRDAYVAMIGDDGNFIAHVMCNDGRLNPLPYKENAALFAAAPDMLALLQELIDIEGPQPGTYDWFTKVQETIAKATGAPLNHEQL